MKKKAPTFIFLIIAIITGSRLLKYIDFENLKVEKPWLSAIYFITLAFSIYMLIRNYKNRPKK